MLNQATPYRGNELDALLGLMLHINDDTKQLKKSTMRIAKRCLPYVSNGLLTNVLGASRPKEVVRTALHEMDQYKEIISELIEDGFHGMIILGSVVYPLQLDIPESETDWALANERRLQLDFASQFMDEQGRDYFHGRVALFSAFGFSGVPRELELKRGAKELVQTRLQGTRYRL